MKTILFTILLSILFVQISNAQWQTDERLTNNTAASNMSYNNARCIASIGNAIHAVWYDLRDGNQEIYYKRSTDGGINWEADTRITNNTANSTYPSVSVSSSAIHVVWHDSRDGNIEVYYKRSTDGGTSWGADTRLTNYTASSGNPSVSVLDQVVHLVWIDLRDGNTEIYYKRSTDGGSSWGGDTRLTNDPAGSIYPSVSESGQLVHVVWNDIRDGNNEIYYKRSTDGGVSWGTDTRLTNNPANSVYASSSVSGQVVHVVWYDNRDGATEIYYKRSTDGGISWEADTRLTNAPANSLWPSISVSGQVVHVAWHDLRDGNIEVYYKRSTDGGVSWDADTRLTNNSFESDYPSISVSGSAIHVLWSDNRDGNFEIYYKRNPTGNVTGIIKINTEIPGQFNLNQNYPNPFNPKTIISFQFPVNSFAILKIYDILGNEVAALVNEHLNAGTYEAEFDGTNYPSGVYYYRLIAVDPSAGSGQVFTETKKMILVK